MQSNPAQTDPIFLPEDARLITPQGVELEVKGSCRVVRDANGHILVNILQLQDVTEEREWMRRQPDLWDRDVLTTLPGHNFMINRLTRLLERERAGERPLSYLHIRLDGVEDVYSQAGTKAGDALIRHLTALVRSQFRDTDILARMATDSFGALLTLCPESVAEKIRTNIHHCLTASQFQWEGKTYRIGVRIGEVRVPPFSGTVEELLAMATQDHE